MFKSIPDNIGLTEAPNLPEKLKFCVGAEVMLADNICVSDRIINCSISTVKHLDMSKKTLRHKTYVKLNETKSGNSWKDSFVVS